MRQPSAQIDPVDAGDAGLAGHQLALAYDRVIRRDCRFNLGRGLGETEGEEERGDEGLEDVDFIFHGESLCVVILIRLL